MNRRAFCKNPSAFPSLSLTGCTPGKPIATPVNATAPTLPVYDAIPSLALVRAHTDRLLRITVCARPFRAADPRIEVERVGDRLVVHNYGHDGSG